MLHHFYSISDIHLLPRAKTHIRNAVWFGTHSFFFPLGIMSQEWLTASDDDWKASDGLIRLLCALRLRLSSILRKASAGGLLRTYLFTDIIFIGPSQNKKNHLISLVLEKSETTGQSQRVLYNQSKYDYKPNRDEKRWKILWFVLIWYRRSAWKCGTSKFLTTFSEKFNHTHKIRNTYI